MSKRTTKKAAKAEKKATNDASTRSVVAYRDMAGELIHQHDDALEEAALVQAALGYAAENKPANRDCGVGGYGGYDDYGGQAWAAVRPRGGRGKGKKQETMFAKQKIPFLEENKEPVTTVASGKEDMNYEKKGSERYRRRRAVACTDLRAVAAEQATEDEKEKRRDKRVRELIKQKERLSDAIRNGPTPVIDNTSLKQTRKKSLLRGLVGKGKNVGVMDEEACRKQSAVINEQKPLNHGATPVQTSLAAQSLKVESKPATAADPQAGQYKVDTAAPSKSRKKRDKRRKYQQKSKDDHAASVAAFESSLDSPSSESHAVHANSKPSLKRKLSKAASSIGSNINSAVELQTSQKRHCKSTPFPSSASSVLPSMAECGDTSDLLIAIEHFDQRCKDVQELRNELYRTMDNENDHGVNAKAIEHKRAKYVKVLAKAVKKIQKAVQGIAELIPKD